MISHRLASEYGLDLLYRAEFHEVYEEHCENPEFKRLLRHMKVVNDDGESAMDEDQWEAASEFHVVIRRSSGACSNI